jgi:hypothetical protein
MVVSKEDKLVVTKDPEFERTTDCRNFDHSMRLCLRLPGVPVVVVVVPVVVLVASIRWVEVKFFEADV